MLARNKQYSKLSARARGKIIVARDNDGENSITPKTITNAKEELEQREAFVEVLMSLKEDDFNDVLKIDSARNKKLFCKGY